MDTQFRRALRKSIVAVLLVTWLSGCKMAKAETGQGSEASDHLPADGVREVSSAHDFVTSLQQALERGERSWVIAMTRFPVQVGEINTALDKEEFLRAYQKSMWDQATYSRDYDKVWNPETVKVVMNESPDHFTANVHHFVFGCGEVWFDKIKDQQFRISGFDISRFRSAGMSIQDCYRVRAFVAELQTAVANNSRNQVAGMLNYPLRYHGAHKTVIFHNAHEMQRDYDLVFADGLRRAIAEQQIWNLDSMTDGVPIGYGFIWISDPSQKGDFKITSIF